MTKQLDYLGLKKSALGGRGEELVVIDQKIPRLVKKREDLLKAMKRDAEVITILEKLTARKAELIRQIPKLEKTVTAETGQDAQIALLKLKEAQQELDGLDEKMRAAYYAR